MSPTSPPTQSPDLSPTLSPRPAALGLLVAASLLGALALAPRASAADLDGGYTDVPSLPQQLVTFGSGWYVRGDIAAQDEIYKVDAGRTSSYNGIGFNIDRSQQASYGLSLGGGYAFTNAFRADILVDFEQPSQSYRGGQPCISTSSTQCSVQGQYNRYDALINGYYDFGPWSIVTPYVGVGVGVGFGQVKSDLYGDTTVYQGSYGYHSFAWALMAGLAFDVFPHVKLDVGYRYLNNGTVFGNKIYDNQIRAGLRYMIDN